MITAIPEFTRFNPSLPELISTYKATQNRIEEHIANMRTFPKIFLKNSLTNLITKSLLFLPAVRSRDLTGRQSTSH